MSAKTATDQYIIKGAEPLPILPSLSFGKLLLDALKQYSESQPENDAVIDASTGETVTYRHLLAKSCTLARRLQSDGYDSNALFAVSSTNSVDFLVPVFAGMFLGVPVALCNPQYTVHEFEHCLGITRPTVMFCSAEVVPRVTCISTIDKFQRVIVLDSPSYTGDELTISLNAYLEMGQQVSFFYDFNVATIDAHSHTALVSSSSGTTGLPKGVMLTHWNLLSVYYATANRNLLDFRVGAPNPVIMTITSLTHNLALIVALLAVIYGEPVVLMRRFYIDHFLATVEKYRVSTLWAVPTILTLMAKNPSTDTYDLTSLRRIYFGGAPLAQSVLNALRQRIKCTIYSAYGTSECTHALCTSNSELRAGSCGRLIDYVQMKVCDNETGHRCLPSGEIGELYFKGPGVMKGYFGNVKATKESLTEDGWFRSGDLGYYDEDGYVYVTGRIKELIKYKSFQVAPAELEKVLLQHKDVEDAAVVGKPDEEAGELPAAFVVKTPQSTLTEAEIQMYVKEFVSPPKHLRGGVIFVEQIPRSSLGKILRRDLRKHFIINNKN